MRRRFYGGEFDDFVGLIGGIGVFGIVWWKLLVKFLDFLFICIRCKLEGSWEEDVYLWYMGC